MCPLDDGRILPPVGEGEPFGIGGSPWPGMAKLIEEAGELLQACGKIIAYPTSDNHPDGTVNMRLRLCEELADLFAAGTFVMSVNGLDEAFINERVMYKLDRFHHWDEAIRSAAS